MISQTFVFIFALILMALILGFGIKSLTDLRTVSDDVELATFVNRIEDKVEIFSNFDVGSSEDMTLFLPSKIERVCFYNPGETITVSGIDSFFLAVLQNSNQDNVFFTPFTNLAKPDYYIASLRAGGDNPLCFASLGKVTFTLTTILLNENIYVEVTRV